MSKITNMLKDKFRIDRKTKPTKQDEGLTEQLTIEETSPSEQKLFEKDDEVKQKKLEKKKFQSVEESLLEFAEKEALRLEEEKKLQESLLTPFTKNKEVDMQSAFDDMVNRVLPKSKFTEVVQTPEPFSEEPALNKELSDFKEKINQQAASILQPTDWMVVRAAEGGTAVPSSITTKRAAVRTKANAMCTQIDAVSDVDALAALYVYNDATPPVRPLGELPTV